MDRSARQQGWGVRVTIVDKSGRRDTVKASVMVAPWRWSRLAKAVEGGELLPGDRDEA